jgi:hypothetical protein
MNRNEPSGTQVLKAGGGGEDIDSGTGTVGVFDTGSGISGDVGLDPRVVLGAGRLTSAIFRKFVTHFSSFISMLIDLGETDLALDNLNPSSLAGRLWLFGWGRVICDRDGSENDICRS